MKYIQSWNLIKGWVMRLTNTVLGFASLFYNEPLWNMSGSYINSSQMAWEGH